MEYNPINEVLLRETNFWCNEDPFYKNIFIKLESLIIIVDTYLEADKSIEKNIIIDFVGGLALLGIGLVKKDDKITKKSELMIAPLVDLIKNLITSEPYRKTLLKESITGGRSLNIPIGKSILNIPITVAEIERFITEDTLLVSKEDVDITVNSFIASEGEKFTKHKVKSEKNITLEEMFIDVNVLNEITQTLTDRGFIIDGVWKGKVIAATSRNPKEKLLAALSLKIQDGKYLRKAYTDKEISISFGEYFKYKSSGHFFKFGQRAEIEQYCSLFNFL
ncbi:MAG: hypothetical protein H8E34_05390 [Bacteroidetes bacterium]|nr:hypothetical protein [Bacteroidota bacterium]MBL6944313.1 hypothetical protein [Bacteroidales bacterium]